LIDSKPISSFQHHLWSSVPVTPRTTNLSGLIGHGADHPNRQLKITQHTTWCTIEKHRNKSTRFIFNKTSVF